MALPYAKKETPLPILNKRHKYYTTSICQKQNPHTQSSIKDTSITPIPFAQKKTPHAILNKKTQVSRQFHLPKKSHTQSSIKKTRVLCHVHLPKELHPIVNIAYVQPLSS
jgi:hypothetical protein